MPKSKEEYDKLKEDRKAKIVNAALKVFCEKGYDSATIDDIMKKSGYSHGLFYHYFKTKKEIFDEVIHLHREHRLIKTNDEIEKAISYKEKLRITIEAIFSDLKSDEIAPYCFYFFVSQSFFKKERGFPPPPKPPLDKKPPFMILGELFAKGQNCGEIIKTRSPHECTVLLFSIITGAALSYVIAPKEAVKNISLPNVDFILDIFCTGDR